MEVVATVVRLAVAGAGLALQAGVAFGGILAVVMVAQLLEHGVLASLHRSKKLAGRSKAELRTTYYRAYWLLTVLYVLGSALWVYLTERWATKGAYGVFFFLAWELAQLALAVTLSSYDELLARAKTAAKL